MPMMMIDFCTIPEGSFVMGARESAHPEDGENPPRSIWIDAFQISQTTVTHKDFNAFVDATGYITEAEKQGASQVFQGQLHDPNAHPIASPIAPWWRIAKEANWRSVNGTEPTPPDTPVVHITHKDARAYCDWNGYRLPTEAEWERAAGKQTGISPHIWQGVFPNDPDGPPHPKPAADGPENEFGLIHACGNVWEWTADRFARLHSPPPCQEPARAA